jgi:hypothetical protein
MLYLACYMFLPFFWYEKRRGIFPTQGGKFPAGGGIIRLIWKLQYPKIINYTYPFGGKPPKAQEPLSFWRETSQSLGTLIFLEGNLPKPGNPYCGPTEQRPTNSQRPTNQLTAEELKYSRHRARQRLRPTNNLLEVWQNLAPFGGRPINAVVEALLTKAINQQSSGIQQYRPLLFFT